MVTECAVHCSKILRTLIPALKIMMCPFSVGGFPQRRNSPSLFVSVVKMEACIHGIELPAKESIFHRVKDLLRTIVVSKRGMIQNGLESLKPLAKRLRSTSSRACEPVCFSLMCDVTNWYTSPIMIFKYETIRLAFLPYRRIV